MIGLSRACRWISVSRMSGSCSVKKPPPEIGGSCAGIAEHQDRRAERLQVAAELLVDHRAFVDDDELGARHRALAVERKGRRHRGLAGRLVGHRLLAARPVDQRMDGARIDGALRAQHLRGLAGEGGELHLPVDMLGEIARQRRLAGAGIAEQPEHLRPPGLQPSRDRLQRVVLLRREFHAAVRQDSEPGARASAAARPSRRQHPSVESSLRKCQ